jgi:hypothetical protein
LLGISSTDWYPQRGQVSVDSISMTGFAESLPGMG